MVEQTKTRLENNIMTDTKRWYNSATIRGAFVAALPAVVMFLKIFGIEVVSEEVRVIEEAIICFFSFVGVVIAIYGRVRATKVIN